ncbi:Ig lambda chain V region 4A [Chelonia mydas]|uniref:Ig lambda chain V region 4A n=1 Tax=Chelonia mydas TaxID=8469 RepID=M7BVU6_CHEMY|nr:Ig lambda chain V region 4A [Chelonia mydas]
MAWAPLLLALLTYCSGVSSQPVVTQEPSMSVAPGGAVTLSCSLSTGAITTTNYPSWYQQKQGSAPRMLIYETNKRPSGIPDRFSGSISGNNAALTITGVQAEDEADYYCDVYTGSSSSRSHSDLGRWGTDTKTSRLFPCLLLQPGLCTGCSVWFLPAGQETLIAPSKEFQPLAVSRGRCSTHSPLTLSGGDGSFGAWVTDPPLPGSHGEQTATSSLGKETRLPEHSSPVLSHKLDNALNGLKVRGNEAELVWIPNMAWAPLLLALLTYCSGASSQPTLTQPPSDSVSPGTTGKLSCTLSSQHSNYNVGWYQQRDGQAPRFLWYGSSTKGDGVPDRFTVSSSGAIRYLTITNLQPEDEAMYYCGADYSSGSSYG